MKKKMSVIRCQNCKKFYDEPNQTYRTVVWGLCEDCIKTEEKKQMANDKEKKEKKCKKKKGGKKKK